MPTFWKNLIWSGPLRALVALGTLLAAGVQAQQGGGSVTTIGGQFAGDNDGTKQFSQFNTPYGLALNGAGSLFIADFGNNAIKSLRIGDTRVDTFKRGVLNGLNGPIALAFDKATNLYVANFNGGNVVKFDTFGNRRAEFSFNASQPTALATDKDHLYVAELNGRIHRVGVTPNAGPLATYNINFPGNVEIRGIAVFENGDMAVSDSGNHVIWLVTPNGEARVFAGQQGQAGRINGDSLYGRLNQPWQIARGPNNSLVVADRGNHQIRVVSCEGVISSLYGIPAESWETFPAPGIFPGWVDGTTQWAEVRDPVGVAVDAGGLVYDSEAYYHLVRGGSGLTFPARCDGSTGGGEDVIVPLPILSTYSGYFPNGVTITVTATNSPAGRFGQDVKLYYTLNGTDPGPLSSPVEMFDGIGQINLPGPVDLAGLRVKAFIGATSSATVSGTPTVVPVPVLFPKSGYYPMGVRVSINTSNAMAFPAGIQLFYTTDGTEPTTNSLAVKVDQNGARYVDWREGSLDLRFLKVKAWLGPNIGRTVSGEPVSFTDEQVRGEIGIPAGRDGENYTASVGSLFIVPIVANLRAGQTMRSLQFVAELEPLGNSRRLERSDFVVLPMSTNDFIQVNPATTSSPDNVISVLTPDGVNQLGVAYFGTNSGFNVNGFGVVAMLGIQFRPGTDSNGGIAAHGSQYRIRLSNYSATSDGQQDRLTLVSLPDRIVTLSTDPRRVGYLLGDTSPGFWYNAGDFGDDVLDNADVNNTIFAAFGFRLPYFNSDAFWAMNVSRDGVFGDTINFVDAETVLRRSLGFDRNIRSRARDLNGNLYDFPGLPPTPPAAPPGNSPAWSRDALISAGWLANAPQGVAVRVPVEMKVRPGRKIYGMQMVARVTPENGGPAIQSVRFVPSGAVPNPNIYGSAVPGLGTLPDAVYARWNNIDPGLEGASILGYVEFNLPFSSSAGNVYKVAFQNTSGAALDDTGALVPYAFESAHALVSDGALPRSPDGISDEWKAHFFGAQASSVSAEADPDRDGFSNKDEFIAGTSPNERDWSSTLNSGTFGFRWVGHAGKKYVVEKSADFSNWNAVTERVSGQDAFLHFNETSPALGGAFFRIKIEP